MLFLTPFNGKSHQLYVSSFVIALLDRGHEVTFLTSQSLNHLKLKNYTEILIDPPFDIHSVCKFSNYIILIDVVLILLLTICFSSTRAFIENER